MSVTVDKPAIVLREALASLKQRPGIAGKRVYESESSQDARDSIGASGRKNLVINGNFDIWQRGTSQTAVGYGSDDRWKNSVSGTTQVVTQETFALGQTDVPNNPKYYSRTVVTSVAGVANYATKNQLVENVASTSGNKYTLSFWAKADSQKNIAVEFAQVFGTGGSPSTTITAIGVTTLVLTTGWQRYTIEVDLPSISGKTLGSDGNDKFQVRLWFDAGSNYDSRTNSLGQQSGTFDIAQVQLEKGSIATDFEPRSIGEELALCKRYYRKQDFYVPATTAASLGVIDMRGIPTITGGGAGFDSTGTTKDSLIAFETSTAIETLELDAEL
jgi:hypothetical protein